MAATITEICDAVVEKIREHWIPISPDNVQRVYLPDVPDPKKLLGRQVYVWPSDYGQEDVASRGEDMNRFRVGIEFAERFTSAENAGRPTKEWCDERIDFVASYWQLLGDARRGSDGDTLFPDPLDNVHPTTAEVVVVFDPDLLREEGIFWSGLVITYQRDE